MFHYFVHSLAIQHESMHWTGSPSLSGSLKDSFLLVKARGGTDLERGYGDVWPWRPPFHASPAARKGPISSKRVSSQDPLLRKFGNFSLYSLNFHPNFSSQAPKFGNFQLTSPQIWKFSAHKPPFSEANVSSQAPHFGYPGRTPLPEKKLSAPSGSEMNVNHVICSFCSWGRLLRQCSFLIFSLMSPYCLVCWFNLNIHGEREKQCFLIYKVIVLRYLASNMCFWQLGGLVECRSIRKTSALAFQYRIKHNLETIFFKWQSSSPIEKPFPTDLH